MTQFRVSKHLIKAGVSEAEQHIIYGECTKRKTEAEQDEIKSLCRSVAGMWTDALYRFVTDVSINHVYICTHFHIPRQTLFLLKFEFYRAYKKSRL